MLFTENGMKKTSNKSIVNENYRYSTTLLEFRKDL